MSMYYCGAIVWSDTEPPRRVEPHVPNLFSPPRCTACGVAYVEENYVTPGGTVRTYRHVCVPGPSTSCGNGDW